MTPYYHLSWETLDGTLVLTIAIYLWLPIVCIHCTYVRVRLMYVQTQIYKCQSHMHKMSNTPNACDGCLILAKKDVEHMQRMFSHTSFYRVTYADTRVENRQDRKNIGAPGQDARTYMYTYVRTYIHVWRQRRRRQILGQDALPTKSIESYENNPTPRSYNYSDRGKRGGKWWSSETEKGRLNWNCFKNIYSCSGWGQRWDSCTGWLN